VEVDDGDAEAISAARQHQAMLEDGTDRLLAAVDLGPALDRAVSGLDEPFRSTILLVDVEDQSYEAAAEILGVPIGTVRSRLFRARRQLQGQLRRFALDAGIGASPGTEAPGHA
jgi:RNA polymerase sigma-70 factor (ECF subfamily)